MVTFGYPGQGDGVRPAPGRVDAESGLSGSPGDAGGDVQDPGGKVVEGQGFGDTAMYERIWGTK